VSEPPLSFRIVNWIGIINQLASAEASRTLTPLGLSLSHFILLNHFSHRPDDARTVTSVARALQLPQPGVTKNIQKLVAKKWLRERANDEDGRSRLIVLTPAGQAKHRAAITALAPQLARAFADWPERDQHTLFALLDRLKLWLDSERDPDRDGRRS
jgi:DNA-binding MarR family transcriptional regulator